MNAGYKLQVLWRWNGKPVRIRITRLPDGWCITWQRWFRIRGGGRHNPPCLGHWDHWRSYSMTGELRDVIRQYRDYAADWRGRGDFS